MEKTIQKYTERLAILKENRARTVDTNTDAENELYDQLIKQVAEFIRDTKQLNILRVSQQRELFNGFWQYLDELTQEKYEAKDERQHTEDYLKTII